MKRPSLRSISVPGRISLPGRNISRSGRYIGLSGRLMILTIGFVLLSEVLIYVPSIARFRLQFLESHITRAQIATLAVEASPDNSVPQMLESELLENAGVLTVALRRNDARYLMLGGALSEPVDAKFDLRNVSAYTAVRDALATMTQRSPRRIRVISAPDNARSGIIDMVMLETPLRTAMYEYSRNILALSLIISIITAGMIYIALHWLLVRPIRTITHSMVRFRTKPEDVGNTIIPSQRSDEIGTAETELAAMQQVVRQSLQQKKHLAELGGAVSRISHDLRNILAHAQLVSDRLSALKDPTVRQLTPGLIQSVGRAIDLCTDTLSYGRADSSPPRRISFELAPLIEEIGHALAIPDSAEIAWHNEVPPELEINADPDHIFRIVQNLGRNAVQAIQKTGYIRIRAEQDSDGTTIDIDDNGPGIPEQAHAQLFEPFAGTFKQGGTGLGLTIARELTLAHGGELHLVRSGRDGTLFRITLPAMPAAQATMGQVIALKGR